jgi:hypothetical protein
MPPARIAILKELLGAERLTLHYRDINGEVTTVQV